MKNIQRPTGTLDFLPQDLYKMDYLTKKFEEVCKRGDYHKYQTPTFEYTRLFQRGVGETTDIVSKEMFSFIPREEQGEEDRITLKPEATAGIVRLFIQEGLSSQKMPIKIFYKSPCFRNERNQKGRFKEFHQLGVEVFGSEDPTIDAEVITLGHDFFKEIGIMDHLTLEINDIGSKESREKYNEKLKEYLTPYLDDLCQDCKDRFDKNPLRIIDCKEKKCKEIAKDAPKILDSLTLDEEKYFSKVKDYLTLAGVDYVVNPDIVRGLDYYTSTAFEFISKDVGSQSTVLGGGRYDGLVKELGGGDISGVGFALGMERLIMALDELNLSPNFSRSLDIYIAPLGEKAKSKAFQMVTDFRREGISSDMDHMDKSLKAQMKYANSVDAKYTLIIGDKELEIGKATLKNMKDSTQVDIDLESQSIIKEIRDK